MAPPTPRPFSLDPFATDAFFPAPAHLHVQQDVPIMHDPMHGLLGEHLVSSDSFNGASAPPACEDISLYSLLEPSSTSDRAALPFTVPAEPCSALGCLQSLTLRPCSPRAMQRLCEAVDGPLFIVCFLCREGWATWGTQNSWQENYRQQPGAAPIPE